MPKILTSTFAPLSRGCPRALWAALVLSGIALTPVVAGTSAQVRPILTSPPSARSAASGVSMDELAALIDQKIAEVAAQGSAARVVQIRSSGAGSRRAPAKVRRTTPSGGDRSQQTLAAGRWSHAGETGPQAWGQLQPAYALCQKGQRQSPIDVRDGLPVQLDPIEFDYPSAKLMVRHAEHTVQVVPNAAATMLLSGQRYVLQHLSFRHPGEVTVNGQQAPGSVHLLHRDAQGHAVMVAVPLTVGTPNDAVQQVWNNLPLERHLRQSSMAKVDWRGFLPASSQHLLYMGSLSTPPCTEGVIWAVMKQPVQVSAEQMAVLARLYPNNARPVQPPYGRLIKDGQ